MSEFEYGGLKFRPLRNFKGEESNFENVSKRLKNIGITPKSWNYYEFYKIAKENNANVDLFEVNGITVIPTNNYLFKYI